MAVELRKLLTLVVEKEAGGLRLAVGAPPCLRVRGVLCPLSLPDLSDEDLLRYLDGIAPARVRRAFARQGVCAFELSFERTRLFVTASRERIELRALHAAGHAIRELDRRLARRLDMPLRPYSSDPELARDAARFTASFGLRVREGKRRFSAAWRGRAYARAVRDEHERAAELCRFLLDVLDDRFA